MSTRVYARVKMRNEEDMLFPIPVVPAAFIDLDDTLVHKNTNTLWLEWRLKKDPRALLEFAVALKNVPYMKRGKLTAKRINSYYRVRTLGLNFERYKEIIDEYFEEKGKKNIYPAGIELINEHKKKSVHTVIITGQEYLIARKFQEYLGVDDLICNKRKIEGEKLGGFISPNCYGEGKIELANEYLKDKEYKLEECAFYTDSISDLPMLERVKYRVIINPDKGLERVAKQRKWPILKYEL
jgi:HAD superfamily hydrolase (TIGR01490 family)